MQTNPLLALLNSRKFMLALIALAVVVAVQCFHVDQTKATTISAAFTAVIIAAIGGTAYEDGQANSVTGGSNTPSPTSTDAATAPASSGNAVGGVAQAMSASKILALLLLPLLALGVGGCASWTSSQVAAEQGRYDAVDPLVKEHVAAHPDQAATWFNWQWSWQSEIHNNGGKAPTTAPVLN